MHHDDASYSPNQNIIECKGRKISMIIGLTNP